MYLIIVVLLSILFIVVGTARFKQHPLLLLLLAALGVGLATGHPAPELIKTIGRGFGDLLGAIGLVVVLGSVVGVVLEQSGAAQRIADAVLRLFSEKRPALAMASIGAVVGIPVFCDSGFIILSKLSQHVARRTGVSPAVTSLGLAGGLYTTHTLVPPTPGPIAAAGNLGAEPYLGLVIGLGLIITIPNILLITWWARRAGSSLIPSLPKKDTAETTPHLPSLSTSMTPILVPLLLITVASFGSLLGLAGSLTRVVYFLGNPLVALLLAVFFCIPLLRHSTKSTLFQAISEGIIQAGPILVLTGAGGAFGAVLKATSLAEVVSGWLGGEALSGVGLLLFAFCTAAFLKTAQGSTTSSLVITSSLLAPFAVQAGFDTGIELALLVAAVGSGGMVASHANDSYFWVVSQFSGLNSRDAYRSFTVQTFLQGLVSITMVLLLYLFL
ncbi:GntP family permease [Telluribacter humicola]|uniref:GntP family permease n=1 Tax=Telluribacter humicola TaxID=1720261 RepID=UPI001A96DB77|nr:GntP family permease [Telluribacter humicola]